MISWIKKNRLEFILLVSLILLASFLRFYRLDEYMNFLGDEGRDGLVVKRILTTFDFPLLGPPTSVGNMYLGPLYYYMMSIPMAIFWLNPVAATGMVALIGVITVGLVYYLCREWFGKYAAITAATLYALSPVNIIYSRSSWNPDPTPFFCLLAIFGLHKLHQSKNNLWFILICLALASAIQMHYLALIMIPVAAILWLYEMIRFGGEIRYKLLGTMLGFLAFLVLILPLIIFDLKYNYLNSRSLWMLVTKSDSSVGGPDSNFILRIWDIFSQKLVGRYISGEVFVLSTILSIVVLIPLIYRKIEWFKKRHLEWAILALGVWLGIGLLGISLFKGYVYDHYLLFVSPAPYLLIGGFVALWKNKWQWIVALGLIIIVGAVNLMDNPLNNPPNRQLQRTIDVSKYIIDKAGGKPFNFALLAERNYDAAYLFIMDQMGHKPISVGLEKTDQLWVVCEDLVCEPAGHLKYEISAYGVAKVEFMEEYAGVKIFKLTRN